MLTIRLARAGVKKRPFFHIRVADSRKPRDGRFIEKVGYFNPIASGQEVRLEIDQERVDFWISQGAQLSDRVTTLLKRNAETPEQTEQRHALKEAKRLKKLSDKAALKVVEEAPAEEAAPAAEAPAEEAAEEAAPVAEEAAEAPAEAPAEEAAEEAAPAAEEAAEAPAEEAPAEEAEEKSPAKE
jgi:small subunit ribosomal protein S16